MQPPNRPNQNLNQEYPGEIPRKQLHTNQPTQTVQINPFQNVLVQQLPINHTNYPLNLLAHNFPNEITTYHTIPLQQDIPSKTFNNPLLSKRSFETLENSSLGDPNRQRLAQEQVASSASIEDLITRNLLNQPNLATALVINPQNIFAANPQALTHVNTNLPMNILQPIHTNINLEMQNPPIVYNHQIALPPNVPQDIIPKVEGTPSLNRRPFVAESPSRNRVKTEEGQLSEESERNPIFLLQEAGNRITELLLNQNMVFKSFENRHTALQKSLFLAIEQTKEIRESLKNFNPKKINQNGATSSQILPQSVAYNSNISSTPDMLTNYLYNNTEFEYNLILRADLSLPLYRGRNFGMEVLLTDRNGNAVKNPTRIPLVVSIYTSENPPQHIEINNSGNKVLKGTVEKYLVNGIAYFEKVQIIEVTSHLRNGWIFLMIQPKNAHTITGANNSDAMAGNIDMRKVRPLIIDKVIVKAKRIKEKDSSIHENDKSPATD